MARFKELKLGEDYLLKLSTLSQSADGIIKQAIYQGADVVADAIQEGIQALPEEGHRKLKQGERFSGVSPTQKQALQEGFGLADMEQDGKGWNTKAGFAGYADESTATKKYPNGLPVPLLARAIESGSSVRQKHPFVRTAVNGARQDAVDAMERTVDKEIRKTMK